MADLKAFILRSEVLHLYRSMLRVSKGAGDSASRGAQSCAPQQQLLPLPHLASLPPAIPEPQPFLLSAAAAELRGEIRRQFDLQRQKNEPQAIRFLLSDGKLKLKQLGEMLGMQT